LADLVHRQVKLIVASGGHAPALHAKAATKTIPILFNVGFDPVQLGLGSSLGQPGGNSTGVYTNTAEMGEKRLEWLHKLLPAVGTVAAVVNPKADWVVSKIELERLTETARGFGQKLIGLEASTEGDLETVFATAARAGAGALSVNGEPFFTGRRAQIIALAARYRLPTIYPWREYVEDGGLMSYGPNLAWAYRLLGNHASRILKGEARRPSGTAAEGVRAAHQPQDREGARPDGAAGRAGGHQRIHRMSCRYRMQIWPAV
jgi:putative ABC transport system substrate-binding protein